MKYNTAHTFSNDGYYNRMPDTLAHKDGKSDGIW